MIDKIRGILPDTEVTPGIATERIDSALKELKEKEIGIFRLAEKLSLDSAKVVSSFSETLSQHLLKSTYLLVSGHPVKSCTQMLGGGIDFLKSTANVSWDLLKTPVTIPLATLKTLKTIAHSPLKVFGMFNSEFKNR